MQSSKGNAIPNQFVLYTERGRYFQSYNSVIAFIPLDRDSGAIKLDEKYWNYSKTTSKYRSIFLNETTKETQAKIDSGIYLLSNLN